MEAKRTRRPKNLSTALIFLSYGEKDVSFRLDRKVLPTAGTVDVARFSTLWKVHDLKL